MKMSLSLSLSRRHVKEKNIQAVEEMYLTGQKDLFAFVRNNSLDFESLIKIPPHFDPVSSIKLLGVHLIIKFIQGVNFGW